MGCTRDRFLTVTTINHPPTSTSLADAQRSLSHLLGTRYRLIDRLDRPRESASAPAPAPAWRTYLAVDTSLRRKVVIRIAEQRTGDTTDLRDRVIRARRAAQLNTQMVAHVYDAVVDGEVVDGEVSPVAPSATTVVIVGEYFTGETLRAAIDRRADLNSTAILAHLAHRVADAADAGVSFGSLKPENVILTQRGPAIARLPVGSVARIGPTSLDALAAAMRTSPVTRAVRRVRRASLRLAHSA